MEERKNLIALFSQETIFVLRRRRRTERGRKRDGRTDGWLTLVVRRPLRPHNVRYVARRGGGGSGDGTSRKRRVSGEGAGGKQCGGEEEGRRDGGRGAGGREGRSLGMVRLPAPAPPPPPWRRVCVFTKRNLQLLPRFRRTVSAMPPRYALAATVAAKVTEEEEEREADGRAGQKRRSDFASPLFPHPSHIPHFLVTPG